MFGTQSFFGDDGLLPSDYGAPPPVPPPHVAQVPGTVVVAAATPFSNVPQVPGTVVVAEAPLPAGIRPQAGTVVVAEAPLPAGIRPQAGTVVVAAPAPLPRLSPPQGVVQAPSVPTIQRAGPLPVAGRGGYSVAGGLPPLPTGAPPLPGGHYIRGAYDNMPLPGRPIAAPPYPSDREMYGIRDGWSRSPTSRSQLGGVDTAPAVAAAPQYRDYPSANYGQGRDRYVYRVYAVPGQPIDVYRGGKVVAVKITAESSPAAYNSIMGELHGRGRADPALIIAAINAATIVSAAVIAAAAKPPSHKRRKFDTGPLSVPPADPVPAPGVPVWVWVAGGGVVLLGLGALFLGRKAEGREAA